MRTCDGVCKKGENQKLDIEEGKNENLEFMPTFITKFVYHGFFTVVSIGSFSCFLS